MSNFKVGDRVARPRDVFDPNSELMHGTIARIDYDVPPTSPLVTGGNYPELIAVEWDAPNDQGYRRGGYLPHGLDREEKA